jgi:hypothetical protein
MKNCKIFGCIVPHYSKDFCKRHYDKNRRHGNPLYVEVIAKGTPCFVGNCGKPIWANGMCAMHDRRTKRHGSPEFVNPKCNRDGGYKERHKAYLAQWKKDNKAIYNAYLASRKTRVKKATPKWADLQAIRDFYFNCHAGHHVDHIVPLNGKIVSGLHVIENLQYLTIEENLKKSNKY